MLLKIILSCIIFFIYPYISSAGNENTTIIKIIDKVSGKSYITEIRKNELLNFRNLAISSNQCITDINDANNFAAFIILKKNNQEKYIFKGWILSKNVSLSQVSHPVYNIKLLECL